MSRNPRRNAIDLLRLAHPVEQDGDALYGVGWAILDLADAIRESNEHKDSNMPERVNAGRREKVS